MSKLPSEKCNLKFKRPITSWDEAVPLGNGLTGCLIWGESNGLRFSLDRGDLWDVRPSEKIKDSRFTYNTLVKCAENNDRVLMQELFDSLYREATPTKLPAGKLIFDFGKSDTMLSELNIADAHAGIEIGYSDKNKVAIRSFVHAYKNVGFIEIDAKRSGFDMNIENPAFGVIGEDDDESGKVGISAGSLKRIKYKPAEFYKNENSVWFVQNSADVFSYGIFTSFKEYNGKTLIVYTVANGDGSEEWQRDTLNFLEDMLKSGYDNELDLHRSWWRRFWSNSSVTIPDELFEKNWYLTNYLFGSCSRKGTLPMPLQGVWTADNGELPPWKGDYHNDLNTQLSYLHYLKANHVLEGESYIDFLWSLNGAAKNFAKNFYGTDGICLPSVMSVDGTPLGGWPMYSFSPTNQIWNCQIFERHYTYTADNEFLRERAYPYFVMTGQCIAGLLVKGENGQYELPVSTSPEIHDDTQKAWLTPNSTYDLSLMRYLFGTLIKFAKLLGEDCSKWQEILDNLPQLSVNENKVLMLSPDESLNESHRHHSHAMPIYPLRQLDCHNDTEREIIDATIKNLEILGTGWWVGFSFTWMSALYAMQKNGEGAAYQLKLFWENMCSPNGFHLNGDYKRRGISVFHYRPFTLEANMSAADSLQEMLLKTHNCEIEPFFAIPHIWKERGVSFESFRGEDGMYISAEIKPVSEYESECSMTVTAVNDGEYTVTMPGGTYSKLTAKAGEKYTFSNRFNI